MSQNGEDGEFNPLAILIISGALLYAMSRNNWQLLGGRLGNWNLLLIVILILGVIGPILAFLDSTINLDSKINFNSPSRSTSYSSSDTDPGANTKVTKEKPELEDLRSMNEYDFEEFVSDLFSKEGYNTEVKQKSNDRGVDILAEKHSIVSQSIAIQAKKYTTGKVGGRDIREYASLEGQEGVDKVVVVTTTGFSKQALEVSEPLGVELIDSERLMEMVDKHDWRDTRWV